VVWPQVHLVEDPPDRGRVDRLNEPGAVGPAGQLGAAPVRYVQAARDQLQAGELDDLGPSEGGNPGRAPRLLLRREKACEPLATV